MHDVCVIGLGYIGLPTAVVFAASGLDVLGVDVVPDVVSAIESGVPHIAEPGLDEALSQVVADGSLHVSLEPAPAGAFILAVPTPFTDDREPDLSYVLEACEAIAPVLRADSLVVLESTSPIGATETVAARLAELRPDLKFPARNNAEASSISVAYCPERVLPGQILREIRDNDRILGGLTPRCTERAIDLYRKVVSGACLGSDARTAELVKLAENSFRDVNIAFANELSMIAADHDIDANSVVSLANRHPRVNILHPGPGVGGHCIAVDPWFIVSSSPERARLIRAAREVNMDKTSWVFDQIKSRFDPGTTVACLGLAYKPDIGDLRESPAVEIAAMLVEAGFEVLVVEPNLDEVPQILETVTVCELDEALQRADGIAVLVAHREFVDAQAAITEHELVFDAVGLLS